jgi:hypothetical protein
MADSKNNEMRSSYIVYKEIQVDRLMDKVLSVLQPIAKGRCEMRH